MNMSAEAQRIELGVLEATSADCLLEGAQLAAPFGGRTKVRPYQKLGRHCFAISARSLSEIPPSRNGIGRRWLRLAGGVAAVLLLPKCLLCAAGYIAIATGLMRAAPELCGANERGFANGATVIMTGSAAVLAAWLMVKGRRGLSAGGELNRWNSTE